MGTSMPEPLQQVCVSLPPNLVTLVQQHAAQTDRTIGGMIRHVVAEWARTQPRPEGGFPDAFAPPVPAVKPAVQSIAEAKVRLDELKQERERIKRRQQLRSDTAADGARLDRLNAEIEVFGKHIAMAERMMPANEGLNV
jgi:hypothetical protein